VQLLIQYTDNIVQLFILLSLSSVAIFCLIGDYMLLALNAFLLPLPLLSLALLSLLFFLFPLLFFFFFLFYGSPW